MSEKIIERDCKTCIYSNWKSEENNGCTRWECEYVNRDQVVKAFEMYLRKKEAEGKE